MATYDEVLIQCPYCFEPVTIFLDPGEGYPQTQIIDCAVCCRPTTCEVTEIHGKLRATVSRS